MKASIRQSIQDTIAECGQHTYLVVGTASPQYAYTIGLTETVGAELVLAGSSAHEVQAIQVILNRAADGLRKGHDPATGLVIKGQGSWGFKKIRRDWLERLMLGALDYYPGRRLSAYQMLPDQAHWTMTVPDLTEPWTAQVNRAWRWFDKPWPFPVPQGSTVTTNLAALRGERITEVARWEEDEWEMFAGAGPDVKPKDVRVVPLGALLGIDKSLSPVVDLSVGQALWRDDQHGAWNPWVQQSS